MDWGLLDTIRLDGKTWKVERAPSDLLRCGIEVKTVHQLAPEQQEEFHRTQQHMEAWIKLDARDAESVPPAEPTPARPSPEPAIQPDPRIESVGITESQEREIESQRHVVKNLYLVGGAVC